MHTARNQIRRGLVTAKKNEGARAHDFIISQRVILFLRRDQCANKIVLRLLSTLGDHRLEIIGKFQHGELCALTTVWYSDRPEDKEGNLIRPLLDILVVTSRHPKQLRDHCHR
jgi:hypothetical protein